MPNKHCQTCNAQQTDGVCSNPKCPTAKEQPESPSDVTPCSQFGRLRLSVEGTGNGQGFDIFYDSGESHDFVEFASKPEFYFIQPWMQFPSKEYSDTCKLVSIEVVRRFNEFDELKRENERMRAELEHRISPENTKDMPPKG